MVELTTTQSKNALSSRVYSIDIFKYICAFAIITGHIDPITGFLPHFVLTFIIGIASNGAQFFFTAAGYFYYRKLITGKKIFFPYFIRLIIPYTLWSIIYLTFEFFVSGNAAPLDFLRNCFFRFFISGTAFHLWFFPSMFFSIILFTLLYNFNLKKLIVPLSVVLLLINVLGTTYIHLGVRIPVLGQLFLIPEFTALNRFFCAGFPFFSAGYIVSRIMERFEITAARSTKILAVVLAVFLFELSAHFRRGATTPSLYFMAFPLIIAILAFLIMHPMSGAKKLASRLRAYSSFSYYSHGFFMSLCSILLPRWVGNDYIHLVTYFITMVLCTGLAELIFRANNKYLNYLAF